MSIPATCPGCKATYQLADTMRGKKVRCKSCSEVFVVGGKPLAPDYDEDEMRMQTSPRSSAKHVAWDEEDEDLEQPPVRRRPRKKSSNGTLLPWLIGGCAVLGVLVLGLGGVAVWVLSRARLAQLEAANFNQPAPFPQPVQAPAPPQNQAGVPPLPMVPPVPAPAPGNGPVAVELSNASITGLGARMQVTVDYRFTAGSPAGRRLFLFIKATKGGGMLQKHYVAELHTIGDRKQGTIGATGMTFGIEHGPFEMWVGEGPPGIGPPLVSDKELKKISNVVTVASKQPGIPGMPGRPPFGPPGMRP
jgi:predicted Zn finger-like uncharacterized protein